MSQVNGAEQIWATYAGDVNAALVANVLALYANALTNGAKRIHFLIQTGGGNPYQALCLYNYLRTHPIETVAYNTGYVASAGVVWYLGAQSRFCSDEAAFMIHPQESPIGRGGTAQALAALSESVQIGNDGAFTILRAQLKLSEDEWQKATTTHLHIRGRDAVRTGLATGVGAFCIQGPLVNLQPG